MLGCSTHPSWRSACKSTASAFLWQTHYQMMTDQRRTTSLVTMRLDFSHTSWSRMHSASWRRSRECSIKDCRGGAESLRIVGRSSSLRCNTTLRHPGTALADPPHYDATRPFGILGQRWQILLTTMQHDPSASWDSVGRSSSLRCNTTLRHPGTALADPPHYDATRPFGILGQRWQILLTTMQHDPSASWDSVGRSSSLRCNTTLRPSLSSLVWLVR